MLLAGNKGGNWFLRQNNLAVQIIDRWYGIEWKRQDEYYPLPPAYELPQLHGQFQLEELKIGVSVGKTTAFVLLLTYTRFEIETASEDHCLNIRPKSFLHCLGIERTQ